MRYVSIALVCIVLPVVVCSAQAAGVWASLKGDPARSGVADGPLSPNVSLAWVYTPDPPFEDLNPSSPVVDETAAYFAAGSSVYALSLETGELKWKYEAGDDIHSSLTLDNGRLYFGSQDGRVYALQCADGGLIWKYPVKAPVESTPLVVGGTVYVGCNANMVVAISADTGRQKWSYQTTGKVKASPAYANGVLFVVSDRAVYALHRLDGNVRQRWRANLGYNCMGTPVATADKVLVPNANQVTAFMADSGMPPWTLKTRGIVVSSPAVANGMVYVGSTDGNLYCVRVGTGKTEWTHRVGQPIRSSPVVAGDVVYVAAEGGVIVGVDAQTGRNRVWEYKVPARPEVKATAVGGYGSEGGGAPGTGEEYGPPPEAEGIYVGPTYGREGGRFGEDITDLIPPAEGVPPEFAMYREKRFAEEIASSVAIAGGAMYILGGDSSLYALLPNTVDTGPPFAKDGYVFIPYAGTEGRQFKAIPVPVMNAIGGLDREDVLLTESLGAEPPVIVQVTIEDMGSGLNWQQMGIKVEGVNARPEAKFYSHASTLQLLFKGTAQGQAVPSGEYKIVLTAPDYRGRVQTASIQFKIDRNVPQPKIPKAPTLLGGGGYEEE